MDFLFALRLIPKKASKKKGFKTPKCFSLLFFSLRKKKGQDVKLSQLRKRNTPKRQLQLLQHKAPPSMKNKTTLNAKVSCDTEVLPNVCPYSFLVLS
jgi:hypothetical protein